MSRAAQYDYIITGAGCAGLSLVMHMMHSGKFSEKKILIVDKEHKNKNDRTWCFWEKDDSLFQPIVYKQWNHLNFYSQAFSTQLDIAPYKYKLVRGIDFYDHCINKLSQYQNIDWVYSPVESIENEIENPVVFAGGKKYEASFVFNSILFQKPQLKKNQYWMLQHFKGWRIQAAPNTFNDAVATLMDFKTEQDEGTTFFYMLPLSHCEALVEYTLFSKELLHESKYQHALNDYVTQRLGITAFEIIEEEFGIIPMTNYPFSAREKSIVNIGTAGGRTKGSSGYTFKFIQKNAAAIVKSLIEKDNPFDVQKENSRFHFYDSVLLDILHHRSLNGDVIFSKLFKKNPAALVLKFLDNETSLMEELKIISTLPTLPFTKAALRQLI